MDDLGLNLDEKFSENVPFLTKISLATCLGQNTAAFDHLYVYDDAVNLILKTMHNFKIYSNVYNIFQIIDSGYTMLHSLGVVTSLDWLLTSRMFGNMFGGG